MIEFLLFFLTGTAAGTLAGLLGIGGGMVVVPALVFIFAHTNVPSSMLMHMAAGTSLAVMILTSISSMYAHYKRGNIRWHLARQFLPGMLGGIILGSALASILSTLVLRILFGIFLMIIAIRMFLLVKPKAERGKPSKWLASFVALLAGFKSGLLGVGGGALIIPFMTRYNVPMREASGTTTVCTLQMGIAGAICFIVFGPHAAAIPYSTGYVYWPAFLGVGIGSMLFAPMGAALGAKLKGDMLKRVFAIALMLISLQMLIG